MCAFLTPTATPHPSRKLRPERHLGRRSHTSSRRTPTCVTTPPPQPEYDTITIGSGLASLSTAALLTAHSITNLTLESHSEPGGAAHTFTRRTPDGPVTFESGPHLFSGLTPPSHNPMHHVMLAASVNLPVIKYDTWGVFLPGRYVPTTLRRDEPLFARLMRSAGGPTAPAEVADLLAHMAPLGAAAVAIPPAVLRARDVPGTLRLLLPRLPATLRHLPVTPTLGQPFGPMLRARVTDPFAREFLNLLCFLLAGVQADRIPTAEVAFMFREWAGDPDGDSFVLERPVGGAAGIAKALVAAIQRDGISQVRTRATVEAVITERGRAVGVRLANGEVVRARKAVISGVSALDVGKLLGRTEEVETEMCPSFMHLHVAVRLTDDIMRNIAGGRLEANYVSVEDWSRGVEHPDNVVLVSVPSAIDDTVAPPGWAVVHAYTPAVEPWEPWKNLESGTAAYDAYKEERARILWSAVNKIFGCDMQRHAYISLVGTPKTHARYLRRAKGSYGPAVDARRGGFGLPFPGGEGVEDFFCVGDGVFPGIGVPAVAGSGWLVANGLVDVHEHAKMLKRIGV